ncbi:hypothetical protein [Paenibacillus sp. J2TS4]|uniref:hypothetical protein n=1 Tax=Paenibacillus sp. J2TS4 TaxID=2807194 RepID=UPI001B1D0277|nr:hypothetical protein [Paenibacillus sp. J2TS4]GIP31816.1 hypothetical protein J2TS4_10260 [Paenibacillus sp. J2TS4]
MKNSYRKPWPLILALGALALIRPIMSMLGLLERIGQPFASIIVTLIITFIWILVVVFARVRQPLVVLLFTGITYGGFAILISAILSPILTGQLQGPLTNPFAVISVLVTNAIWGLLAGLLASAWMRARQL